ncbi:MAG: hypothetical protein M3N95_07340 [Actinomycetota bacterium]|nr:hypothetical protein [Actinomycetota bacterium]
MADTDEPVPEAPATWENIVEGEVREIVGHLTRNDEMVERGKEEVDIAHDVREEYREERER